MAFTLIKGTYHLVNRSARGKETGFEPDGDSLHFKPENPELLKKLRRVGRYFDLTNIGSTQLRFEGIDALELHYRPDVKGAPVTHQPLGLARAARDALTGLLALNPVPYVQPRGIQVNPPVPRDAAPGFILSQTLEVNGRPVAFAFAGKPPAADGSEHKLNYALIKRSLNYALLQRGHAYPMFYDGLSAAMRTALADAVKDARRARRGLWVDDFSQKGLPLAGLTDLETNGVIFPKLFRRLAEFLSTPNAKLTDFSRWLNEEKPEILLDLRTLDFSLFGDVVMAGPSRVRLTRMPEEMVFISAR